LLVFAYLRFISPNSLRLIKPQAGRVSRKDSSRSGPSGVNTEPGVRRHDPRTIFVRNVPDSYGEAELRNIFEKLGTVIEVSRLEGRPYGFVTFESPEIAQTVLRSKTVEADGATLAIRPRVGLLRLV
jgi:RNA recognition motif-containing protein